MITKYNITACLPTEGALLPVPANEHEASPPRPPLPQQKLHANIEEESAGSATQTQVDTTISLSPSTSSTPEATPGTTTETTESPASNINKNPPACSNTPAK